MLKSHVMKLQVKKDSNNMWKLMISDNTTSVGIMLNEHDYNEEEGLSFDAAKILTFFLKVDIVTSRPKEDEFLNYLQEQLKSADKEVQDEMDDLVKEVCADCKDKDTCTKDKPQRIREIMSMLTEELIGGN